MTSRFVRSALGVLVALALTTSPAVAAEPDLRLETVRESLTGTHYRYRQYVDGLPVVGGEVVITRNDDGVIVREQRQLAVTSASRIAALTVTNATHMVNIDGVARPARREVREEAPLRPIAYYYDAITNELLRVEPLYFNAKPARVFEANPVTKLNAPELRDANDAASAVPAAAYSDVQLEAVNESGGLAGPNVRIVDVENPAIAPIDAGRSLLLDREDDGFEDVNAYFHVDRMQRYLQALGYDGARRLVPYALPVDAHAAGGADNSYYISSVEKGRGTLYFGDGGTDDAEDPDLVVHEYGHAVLDWIAPLAFSGGFGSEPRALGEAFSDYLAFSDQYRWNVASGRDASCFADWDARCGDDDPSARCAYASGSDCLRRLDGNKTMADYITRESSGVEHQNSTIWSAALRELFLALNERYGATEGKRISDTLVVESMFGLPATPTFADDARSLLFVDALLFGGAHAPVICAAATARGVLADCGLPRGEWTLHPGSAHGVAIPDVNSAGIVARVTVTDPRLIEDVRVRVDIQHPSRGDLRLSLVAPDGTEVVLQNISVDRAPDVHVTFGLSATTAQSLAILRGRSAAGEWQLRVSDLRPGDTGTLESWGLMIRFAGETALASRPTGRVRAIFPAGHVPGPNATLWATDLRLYAGAARTAVSVIFSPGHADGRTEFNAVRLVIEPEQVVVLNDVVSTLFGTAGFGAVEVAGDSLVEVTSRSYASTLHGTVGEIVPAYGGEESFGFQSPLRVPVLRSDASFRSNLTIAETRGGSGVVQIQLFDAASGALLSTRLVPIQPHGLLQVPAAGAPRMTAEVSMLASDDGGAVRVYASVIDQLSSDTAIIVAPNAGGTAPAISAPGATGAWRTDLWLSQSQESPLVTPVRFVERSSVVTLPPPAIADHMTLELPDAVSTVFARPGAFGFINADANPFVARVYTNGPNGGTVGQTITARRFSYQAADLLFIRNDSPFRTNLGVLNAGTDAVTFRMTLLDSAGRPLGSTQRVIGAGEVMQFPASELVAAPFADGRVHFEVIGEGLLQPWASLIDRRSNDASYIAPR